MPFWPRLVIIPSVYPGPKLQLIAANLPLEIGRQLTNVCTVRFGTYMRADSAIGFF